MAEWRSSPGSVPAFVSDDVVAVVGGQEQALEAIARIERASSVFSLVELIDVVLASGAVASAPDFFIGVRRDGHWRCAIRGAIEVVIDGQEGITGATVETWHELTVPVEVGLEVRVLFEDGDPWQPIGGGPIRVGGLRREGSIDRSPNIDSARTLAALPEAVDEPFPSPPLVAPPAPSPSPPPSPSSSSRYDDLFGELTVAGGVAAAAVVEQPSDAAGHATPTGSALDPQTTDTATGFDHSAVAVSAILCAQHHPNPPERERCWRCSAGLDSRAIVRVPRPSLGTLALDDGRQVEIDRTVLLGRNPRAERTDAAHLPALISVGSDAAGVSRTHARVFLDGWQVLVEDLGSTFGTNIISVDGTTRRLRPGQPELVSGDSVLDLGGGCTVRIVGVP